jgi:hypothetical protein
MGLFFIVAKFNHTQRTWLVIWEAGVIVELPPWVLAIYPSSLFYHFNIDVNGMSIRFFTHQTAADFHHL